MDFSSLNLFSLVPQKACYTFFFPLLLIYYVSKLCAWQRDLYHLLSFHIITTIYYAQVRNIWVGREGRAEV